MTQIPGPKEGLTDLLDRLTLERLAKDSKTYYPLRPSSAGHCARKLAYELAEFKELIPKTKQDRSPAVARLLDFGYPVETHSLNNFKVCEEIFTVRYKQQTVDLFKLKPVNGEESELVSGSIDAFLWSDQWKGVMDIKSQKDGFDSGFETRWDKKLSQFSQMRSLQKIGDSAFYAEDLQEFIDESNDPFLADNLYQLNAYCHSDFFLHRGVTFGSIYKYNKNDSRHYEIRFKPHLGCFKYVEAKFNMVNEKVLTGKLDEVPREFPLGSTRCAYCPFQKQCWNADAKKALDDRFPQWHPPKDISKVEDPELAPLFNKFKELEDLDKDLQGLEEKILTKMSNHGIKKIRLESGEIFQVKVLKNSLALRRAKK